MPTPDVQELFSQCLSKWLGAVLKKELLSIQGIEAASLTETNALEGLQADWEIDADEIKLVCVNGRPVELGRGGCGIVLLAKVHREDAAVKMIKHDSKDFETALLLEIATLERAKTKYVTCFLGFSLCREGIMLAMEYLEGGGLH